MHLVDRLATASKRALAEKLLVPAEERFGSMISTFLILYAIIFRVEERFGSTISTFLWPVEHYVCWRGPYRQFLTNFGGQSA
jgi:hypothetical protein